MGYCHYWGRRTEFSADAFALWSADVAKIIASTSVSIAGPKGEGEPVVTASLVAFNGNIHRSKVGTNPSAVAFELRKREDGTGIEAYNVQPVPSSTWVISEACESFSVPQVLQHNWGKPDENGMYWDSVKTAKMPYDEVVTAALVLLDYYFPQECAIRSDGKVKDWSAGIALARTATGLHVSVPAYAHVWLDPPEMDSQAFSAWSSDIARVIEIAGISLAGRDGTGKPEITERRVAFNGTGSDARNPFIFAWHEHRAYPPHDEQFYHHQICRTGQRPYDVVVTAALILLAFRLPETLFASHSLEALFAQQEPDERYLESSGGSIDWQPGLELARRATGLDLRIPMLK